MAGSRDSAKITPRRLYFPLFDFQIFVKRNTGALRNLPWRQGAGLSNRSYHFAKRDIVRGAVASSHLELDLKDAALVDALSLLTKLDLTPVQSDYYGGLDELAGTQD